MGKLGGNARLLSTNGSEELDIESPPSSAPVISNTYEDELT